MIYLASPYSDPDPDVMAERANEVAAIAAKLFCNGLHIYCPIAAWHWVAVDHELPKDWPAWRGLDFAFLRHATEMWIADIPGWEKSVGVTAERKLAEHMEIPVRLVQPGPGSTMALVTLPPRSWH